MEVEWFGQSAFRCSAGEQTVAIDPFGDVSALAAHGMRFDYPPISGLAADLLLITHEHIDHNAAEVIAGSPVILRSTAGRLESPLGEVTAIASEHDRAAGTERGANTIFAFTMDGVRVCHFGDFGQRELRAEQAEAIGGVDLLFIPVGGGPTIDAGQAAEIVERLAPRWVVPMHYRTERISFLEDAEAFLGLIGNVLRSDSPRFQTEALPAGAGPLAVVPAVP